MRVLMVGLGGIGQRHVRNLRRLLGDQVEVLAYRVRGLTQVLTDQLTIEPGSELAGKYALTIYSDLDQALEQKPDAVFVCNPSSMHVEVAQRAAEAGCHLFVEKPLSHSWEGIEELTALVERRRLVTLVGYQMRWHPCLQRLHELLGQGAVGRVLAVRAEVGEFLPQWHTYEDYRHMYASRADLGGGVILAQIHEFDYLYWLFGLPRRVFALGGHLSSLEIDVEDVASILLEFMVRGAPVPVHVHLDYVQRPPRRTLQVIGDQGKVLIDLRALTLEVFDGQGTALESRSFEGFERNQMFLAQLQHFLDCMSGQSAPLISARDGAQSLRMALAAKESLQTGAVVSLT